MKNPATDGGVLQIGQEVQRARRSEAPARGAFFEARAVHEFVITSAVWCALMCLSTTACIKKKAGLAGARLE
jgi:hypothetical protein